MKDIKFKDVYGVEQVINAGDVEGFTYETNPETGKDCVYIEINDKTILADCTFGQFAYVWDKALEG